ncbi:hypothetical protein LZ3411_0405 [Levilactobacillus zymae]|uniref:Uncharacterized protein n=1 Tax=Levilactobacillus zymae TaxID=267363 RepID=A0A1Y6JUC7_9LACO|nr:hypothetical protein LZ3411_0405 [Levilactobacillus zymae]
MLAHIIRTSKIFVNPIEAFKIEVKRFTDDKTGAQEIFLAVHQGDPANSRHQ